MTRLGREASLGEPGRRIVRSDHGLCDTGPAPSRAPEAEALLERVYGARPAAPRVGVTGPPGAGKSTLVAELALLLRRRGKRVGVVAVDPTSPYTGGAILGDRVRMSELSTDPEVFIRIHRRAIVKVEEIREVESLFHGDYEVVLRTGARLPVGRKYRDRLLEAMGGRARM